MIILLALGSVVVVSLLSLLGALFFILKKETFEKLISFTLALSSGVLLGSVFLDLLPESVENLGSQAFVLTLVGFVLFFMLEKLLSWHHHIEGDHVSVGQKDSQEKPFAYLTLIGDGIHNFVDGVLIGAAYIVSIPLGVTTTLAVIAHEVPHELADFTILLFGGFSRKKALFYNFLSALTAVAGTALVVVVARDAAEMTMYLIPVAAGNFLYIAASDLIPALHTKHGLRVSMVHVVLLVIGIFFVYSVKNLLFKS